MPDIAITLTVQEAGKDPVTLQASRETVELAATRKGWVAIVPDAAAQRAEELLRAKFYSLEPSDPQRAAMVPQLQEAQAASAKQVPNPVSAASFLISGVSKEIFSLVKDPTAVQAAASAAAIAEEARQEALAAAVLGLAPAVPTPITE